MKTVLVTGARAPTALHLARLLHAAGAKVILADSLRFPLASATASKAKYVRLPAPNDGLATYAQAVGEMVEHEGVDLIIPTCEEVFHLAAARDVKDIKIPLFAPSLDKLRRAHDKGIFASSAVGFGADPPNSWVLTSPLDITNSMIPFDKMVLKPVFSRFASKVFVKPTAEQLREVTPSEKEPWLVQEYLPGEEISAYAVAFEGRVLAIQSYRPLYRVGLGAGVAFEPVTMPGIDDFVRRYVAANDWTGQISFDFRHDEAGNLHAIECNPRATSGIHFFGANDGLAKTFLENATATASIKDTLTLPLAMLAYGLPASIAKDQVSKWWDDFQRMKDISAWKNEFSLIPAQLLAMGEIATMALTSGRGMSGASTVDIEWNGQAF